MKTNTLFKQTLFFFLLIISSCSFSQSIIDITGTVVDSDNTPVPGANIVIKGTTNATQTDIDGNFAFEKILENSILVVSYIGFTTIEVAVEGKNKVDIKLDSEDYLEEVVVSGSVSSKNYWIGAKIGYNFIGDTDDNFFVGSASISINLIEGLGKKHMFGVIGNIGNFKFDKKEENNNDDIKKLAQSINGVSVGLGYTHESEDTPIFYDNGKLIFRQFIQTGLRITSFDEIGEDKETETLAQSATTAGLEMEITGFKNKGALTLSTGVSLYLFDSNIYQKIFENDKGSLVTLDCSIILPIAEKVGFFMNGTFSKDSSAAFIMGIILKP